MLHFKIEKLGIFNVGGGGHLAPHSAHVRQFWSVQVLTALCCCTGRGAGKRSGRAAWCPTPSATTSWTGVLSGGASSAPRTTPASTPATSPAPTTSSSCRGRLRPANRCRIIATWIVTVSSALLPRITGGPSLRRLENVWSRSWLYCRLSASFVVCNSNPVQPCCRYSC